MKKVVVVTLALFLASCANIDEQRISTGAIFGAVAGAAAGGLLGAQFGGGLGNMLFVATGAAVGGSAGYVIGQRMEDSDWSLYDNTAREALADSPDGGQKNWSNPDTGASGIVRPTRSFRTQTGQYCRDYRATVAVSDMVQSGDGTACLGSDGVWYAMRDEIG